MDTSDAAKVVSCCRCSSHVKAILLLRCFHSICDTCAETFHEITCPICQEVTPFESLTVNSFSVISQRASRIASGQETCERCSAQNGKNQADWWCNECSQALCENCLELHNADFETIVSDEVSDLRDKRWEKPEECPRDVETASEDDEDEAFDDATYGSSSSEESVEQSIFHTVTSLVGALQYEHSTVWQVQRRCELHGMMSCSFCIVCKTMKCKKCLNDCFNDEHKICTAKDGQDPASLSDVAMNEARAYIDRLALFVEQQDGLTWLRHIEARDACVQALIRKKRDIMNAAQKAYRDARAQLDAYLEGIENEHKVAKLHATRAQQAVQYGELLLQNAHLNASRHQWQLLMPRIQRLTYEEQKLLLEHSTTTPPVVEDRVNISDVDDLCQKWYGCNIHTTGDKLATKDSEDSESENGLINHSREESFVSDSALSGCNLSETAMKQLITNITSEMRKLTAKYGQFAYYFGKNMEVEAYVTSETQCSTATLQADLEIFLRGHISDPYVKVSVKHNLPFASFCCGGIGSLLAVGRMEQTVGIYVQYQGRGTIYWVSAAHGLLKCLPESSHRVGPVHWINARAAASMHTSNTPKMKAQFSACPDMDMLDISVPYVALSSDPIPLPRNNRGAQPSGDNQDVSRTRDTDFLCHSVDIMMGPTPLTNLHVSNYSPCKSSFVSAVSGCCPPLCSARQHVRGNTLYTISDIRYFDSVTEDGCTTFLMQDLVGESVRCYMGNERQVATGRVDSVYNYTPAALSTDANAPRYVLQNVLRIIPTGDVRPAEGHSGSVWVLQRRGTGNFEAVAITCAAILPSHQPETFRSDCHEAWLASPLCACLLAISQEYPNRFRDYREFKVLD